MEKDEHYYQAYLDHHRISRRGLFRGMFAATEKQISTLNNSKVLRPPFAAKEELFLAACNGCGDCVKSCELGLIHIEQDKAVLNLDYASCTFCAKCAASCSTKALHLAFKADTQLRPTFNKSCLQFSQQSCTTCQQACPKQAISANLIVDAQQCNGCGECALACFMSSIELRLS